jgi:YHS domain-containing protein
VTDNELGSMGKPLSKTYGDQEVRFCCKPCVKKFEQNPAKYLKKLGK